MKSPIELWVYLSTSPLLWLTVTVLVWIIATKISSAMKHHPLFNPVLLSIAGLASLLWMLDIPYMQFFAGAQFVHFLLGPATVAIAVPLYNRRHEVKVVWIPIVFALSIGSLTAICSAYVLCLVFGLPNEIMISFLPKSVTAGVAMAIASELGGNPSLTAVLVILTGVIGAVIVTPLMNFMKITNYAARGFAVGLTSHGIGTARAYNVNETAGLFAGIAMAFNAVLTSVLVPAFVVILDL